MDRLGVICSDFAFNIYVLTCHCLCEDQACYSILHSMQIHTLQDVSEWRRDSTISTEQQQMRLIVNIVSRKNSQPPTY